MAPKAAKASLASLLEFVKEEPVEQEEEMGEEGEEGPAGGQGEGSSVLKKPSSKLLLKRPASALLRKKPSGSQQEAKGEKQKVKEEQEEDQDAGTRDRMKARKLQQVFDDLPSDMQDFIRDQSKGAGSRAKMTKLTNELISRDEKGRMQVVLDRSAPVWQSMLSYQEEKFAKRKKRGVLKPVAANMCGGQAQLQAAIDEGVVEEVEDEGVSYFIFREVEVGSKSRALQATIGGGQQFSNTIASEIPCLYIW
eukprot:291913-Alexandrium_andersonii.AAC.1